MLIFKLMLGDKVVVGVLSATADIAVLLYFKCCCFADAPTFPIASAFTQLQSSDTVFGADVSFW